MFVRTVKSVLAIASLTTLVTTTGCLTDLVAPETTNERARAADSLRQEVAEKISPVDYTVEPCAPSLDLVPNGRIDASDLAQFAARAGAQDPAVDFTENGVVDEFDRRVLEAFMGRAYSHDCVSKVKLFEGCYPYANPDINGSGWIDASDLSAFLALQGDPRRADFNGDGAVDALDRIILEEHLGEAFTLAPCTGSTQPCDYPSPDLNRDGLVTASDLAAFAALGSDLAADITGNGVVNDNDLKVIQALLGKAYVSTCELPKWMISSDCQPYASPDMNGSGWVDASDLALFYSGSATLAQADFNGDRVIDTFDEVILLDRLGTAYTTPSCSRPVREQRKELQS